MSVNNNIQDYLTDIANAIRTKEGTTDSINAQSFSNRILNLSSGVYTITPETTFDDLKNAVLSGKIINTSIFNTDLYTFGTLCNNEIVLPIIL